MTNRSISRLCKLSDDLLRYITSYSDFEDKTKCIVKLDKSFNAMINNDIPYFNEWLSRLFDYGTRKLYITNWLKDTKSAPIDPLVRTVSGKQCCIYKKKVSYDELENEIANIKSLDPIIEGLDKKYMGQWNDITLKPSLKHWLFQKEIVEIWESSGSDEIESVPCELFEFIDVIADGPNIIYTINHQKRGIAIMKFISSSKRVRDKIKKIHIGDDKNELDYRLFAYEYAMNIGMQTYHLPQINIA